jgi:pyridoxal phosphate enzyme (YggS family)
MEYDIAAGISRIEERIAAACLRSGRKREEIRLMAVSKFHPLSAVEEAWKQGIRLFGENRVQEGTEKFADFRESRDSGEGSGDRTEVHLIGSLQRNKAKKGAEFFDCIQSVDRESLIDELGILTVGRAKPLRILLELHTGEKSKAGFPDTDSLYRGVEKVFSYPGLKAVGLMTMAPFTDDGKLIRVAFRRLRETRDELEKRFPQQGGWPCLSMGMSGDFEPAVEEGSTLVRIGTAIFGERRQ